MMGFKNFVLLTALLAGSLALPAPEQDLSIFFNHVDPTARIIGGTAAAPGSVPWVCGLTQGSVFRSYFCGASLITQRTVMTAAHCIDAVFSSWSGLTSTLRIHVGHNQWASGTQYSVLRNVTHPNYVSSIIKNDLGLLITNNNIVFNNNVRPVAISFDFVGGGVPVHAAGWGRTSISSSAISANLMELRKETITGERCVAEVPLVAAQWNVIAPAVQPHIELCTFHSAGRGMCNGDSGTGLVRTDRNEPQQVGIVSWGIPCARGGPDMFVRVSAYRSWIVANTV